MKKLGRNTFAVGMATLLVTSAVSLSANAAPGDTAQANSSASTGTGLFETLDLDSGICEALFPGGITEGSRCGAGLDTNDIDAFDQIATAGVEGQDGVSSAEASVSPIFIEDFTAIDLTDLVEDVSVSNTETILDPLLGGLGTAVALLLETLGLDAVVDPVDDAVQDALAEVEGNLPISLRIGIVESQCTAEPGSAQGSSVVGDIDLLIELGPDGPPIVIPIVAETSENANLLVNAPNELLDGVFDGLRASLEESLDGALSGVNALLTPLEESLVDPLFDALEPTLLQNLSDALEPLVSGEVNRQTRTGGDQIEVAGLDLTLLSAVDETNNLILARSECGPNNVVAADDNDDDAVAGDDTDGAAGDDTDGAIADSDTDGVDGGVGDGGGQGDADVVTSLPNAGAPNLLPFWLLGAGLIAFGGAVLLNERRRTALI